MRVFRDADAFPFNDLGVRLALGTKNDRDALARAEAWRPWRAYATVLLWRSL
jgi:AraC family transcriptional regulator of adaptative response / DNA-3-methyladenine glycosylase II